jgi:hypothetical protein
MMRIYYEELVRFGVHLIARITYSFLNTRKKDAVPRYRDINLVQPGRAFSVNLNSILSIVKWIKFLVKDSSEAFKIP